jgi:hypothetical protein
MNLSGMGLNTLNNMNLNNMSNLNALNMNLIDSNLSSLEHPPRKGRRKINIEFIEDKSRRLITFSKRKAGIMKKAYELATLTGTQVLLLVASETGHVYTFATPTLQPLITQTEGKSFIQTCLNSDEIGYEHFQIPDEETPKDSRLLKPRPEKASSSNYNMPSPTTSYSYSNLIYNSSSLPMSLPLYSYQYSNLQPLQLAHSEQKQLEPPPRLDYSFLGSTSHLGVGTTSQFNQSTVKSQNSYEKPVLKQEEGTEHDPDQGMNEKVRFTPGGGFYSPNAYQDQLHLETNFL